MSLPTPIDAKRTRASRRRQSLNTVVGRLLGLHAHMEAIGLRAEAVAVANILAEIRTGALR